MLRGLCGIDLLPAAACIRATGDLSRFEPLGMLMSNLGLLPSEHSSGGRLRRGGITKTGNREARRMLIEAAWSYRYRRTENQARCNANLRVLKPYTSAIAPPARWSWSFQGD